MTRACESLCLIGSVFIFTSPIRTKRRSSLFLFKFGSQSQPFDADWDHPARYGKPPLSYDGIFQCDFQQGLQGWGGEKIPAYNKSAWESHSALVIILLRFASVASTSIWVARTIARARSCAIASITWTIRAGPITRSRSSSIAITR